MSCWTHGRVRVECTTAVSGTAKSHARHRMYAAPPHDREETRGCTTRQGPHPVALSPTHEGRSEPPPPASGLRTFSLVSLHTASPSHACTNSPAAVCARERDENVESESAGACEQPRARPRERTDDGVWRAVIVAAAATEAAATAAKAAAAAAEAASWAARGATEGAPAAGRAPPAAEAPPGAPSGAACWWPHASGEDTRLVTCCHVAPRGSKPQPSPRLRFTAAHLCTNTACAPWLWAACPSSPCWTAGRGSRRSRCAPACPPPRRPRTPRGWPSPHGQQDAHSGPSAPTLRPRRWLAAATLAPMPAVEAPAHVPLLAAAGLPAAAAQAAAAFSSAHPWACWC